MALFKSLNGYVQGKYVVDYYYQQLIVSHKHATIHKVINIVDKLNKSKHMDLLRFYNN